MGVVESLRGERGAVPASCSGEISPDAKKIACIVGIIGFGIGIGPDWTIIYERPSSTKS